MYFETILTLTETKILPYVPWSRRNWALRILEASRDVTIVNPYDCFRIVVFE
jgi:hypothetical protein